MNSALQSVLSARWTEHPTTRELVKKLSTLREEALTRAMDLAVVEGDNEVAVRAELVKAATLRLVNEIIEETVNNPQKT